MSQQTQPADVTERLIDLTRELRVVEQALDANASMSPEILGEFKSAIDQMRLNAWMLMVGPEGRYDAEAAAHFRLQRLSNILWSVHEDIRKGLVNRKLVDVAAIRFTAQSVLDALECEPASEPPSVASAP